MSLWRIYISIHADYKQMLGTFTICSFLNLTMKRPKIKATVLVAFILQDEEHLINSLRITQNGDETATAQYPARPVFSSAWKL